MSPAALCPAMRAKKTPKPWRLAARAREEPADDWLAELRASLSQESVPA